MRKTNKRIQNRIIARIKNIIEAHTYLSLTKDGYYQCDIYADYTDEFCDSSIKKIFTAKNAREKFYESLDFMDCECAYIEEALNAIKLHFNDVGKPLDSEKHEDFIRDWVNDHVLFNYPYDHYLGQEVYLDIIVDTGDGNYDYTMNELFGCNYSHKGLDDREESALVWLMQQQGYSMDAIKDFVENDNLQNSKLLTSIHQECLNTTTCMNSLTFFVKMSLGEALDLHEIVKNANPTGQENLPTEIILDKSTPCGLYDAWNGAGSVLEINLEKDVVLPVKFIDSAMPDGCRGYSVANIYGMLHSFWGDGCVSFSKSENIAA